jgi:ribosomal protein S15P/S13E
LTGDLLGTQQLDVIPGSIGNLKQIKLQIIMTTLQATAELSITQFTPEQADQLITRIMDAAEQIQRKDYFGNEGLIQPTSQTAGLIRYLRGQLKDQTPGRIEQRLAKLDLTRRFESPADEDAFENRISDIKMSGIDKLRQLANRYANKNNGANLQLKIEDSLQEVESLVRESDGIEAKKQIQDGLERSASIDWRCGIDNASEIQFSTASR